MKYRALSLVLALVGGALALTLFLGVGQVAPVQADGGVLYVAPGGNCDGVTPCFAHVQAAVDAASEGDEIRVAAGTYTGVSARGGVTQVAYISKTLTLRGGYSTSDWTTSDPDANPTTLDAEGKGRVFFIYGGSLVHPVIEGFRLTGGNAAGLGGSLWGDDTGGALQLDWGEVTLRNNIFLSNTAAFGGAAYLYDTGELSGNTFRYNEATERGGALYLSHFSGVLHDNTLKFNTAEEGGGMYLRSAIAHLRANAIVNNSADYGGGLYFQNGFPTRLEHNAILSNTATHGGGVCLNSNTWGTTNTIAIFEGDVIAANTADEGGGFYSRQGFAVMTNTVIVDNHANTGSGLYIQSSSPRIWQSTIARNTGGSGVYVYHSIYTMGAACMANITNTIIASHTVGISVTDYNEATLNGILWYGNGTNTASAGTLTVTHAYTGDPAFAADGYHITAGSAAIDQGVATRSSADIDNQVRPFGAGVDLGADEWATEQATLEPSTPSVLTALAGGLTTTVNIPSDAVNESTDLKYTAFATATHALPAGFSFAGRAFDLDAYRGGALLTDFTFDQAVTVTLHYAEADVEGLDEATLSLEYWDEDTSTWEDAACGAYDRHPDENWLSVPICHLSRFALLAEKVNFPIYLPLVLRQQR